MRQVAAEEWHHKVEDHQARSGRERIHDHRNHTRLGCGGGNGEDDPEADLGRKVGECEPDSTLGITCGKVLILREGELALLAVYVEHEADSGEERRQKC